MLGQIANEVAVRRRSTGRVVRHCTYDPEVAACRPGESEVSTASPGSHPNVCRVYDVGEVDGHHYLSMEYGDGEDLASLLRRIGRVPKDKAVQISRQLCAGLAAAHEQGILHRHLKPANVMIDGRGRARELEALLGVDKRRDTNPFRASSDHSKRVRSLSIGRGDGRRGRVPRARRLRHDLQATALRTGPQFVPTPQGVRRDFGAFHDRTKRAAALTRIQSSRWGASGRRFKSSRPDQLLPPFGVSVESGCRSGCRVHV